MEWNIVWYMEMVFSPRVKNLFNFRNFGKRKSTNDIANDSVAGLRSPPPKMRNIGTSGGSDSESEPSTVTLSQHVNAALQTPKKKKKKGKKIAQATQSPNPQSSGIQVSEVVQIVLLTLNQLLPSIISAVQEAVTKNTVSVQKVEDLESGMNSLKVEVEKLKSDVFNMQDKNDRHQVLGRIDQDKQDQQMRAKNMAIFGVSEAEAETEDDLQLVVKDIAKEIGHSFQHEFSVQRIGKKKGDKPRGLLVKCSSKDDKDKVIERKKALKNNKKIKEDKRFSDFVVVVEDVTQPRQRLLRYVRNLPQAEFAFIKDGAILVKERLGKFVKIETPDDLFKLGVKDLDCGEFFGK